MQARPTGEERYTRRAMRVATVTPILVDVPLASPVRGVHGTTAVQRSVLVRVSTDEGIGKLLSRCLGYNP